MYTRESTPFRLGTACLQARYQARFSDGPIAVVQGSMPDPLGAMLGLPPKIIFATCPQEDGDIAEWAKDQGAEIIAVAFPDGQVLSARDSLGKPVITYLEAFDQLPYLADLSEEDSEEARMEWTSDGCEVFCDLQNERHSDNAELQIPAKIVTGELKPELAPF